MPDPPPLRAALTAHLERHWGPVAEHRHDAGPMAERFPDFRVLVAERPDDQGWLACSCGASLERTFDGVGHEVCVVGYRGQPFLVELVTVAAFYVMTGDHDGVHEAHTLNVGRPWTDGAEADHLYLSAPWLLPPEARVVAHATGSADLLWAVPVTRAEKEWRHEHGQEAFEQLMEDRKLVPTDPNRRSMV